jgi:hypothetical protein
MESGIGAVHRYDEQLYNQNYGLVSAVRSIGPLPASYLIGLRLANERCQNLDMEALAVPNKPGAQSLTVPCPLLPSCARILPLMINILFLCQSLCSIFQAGTVEHFKPVISSRRRFDRTYHMSCFLRLSKYVMSRLLFRQTIS